MVRTTVTVPQIMIDRRECDGLIQIKAPGPVALQFAAMLDV